LRASNKHLFWPTLTFSPSTLPRPLQPRAFSLKKAHYRHKNFVAQGLEKQPPPFYIGHEKLRIFFPRGTLPVEPEYRPSSERTLSTPAFRVRVNKVFLFSRPRTSATASSFNLRPIFHGRFFQNAAVRQMLCPPLSPSGTKVFDAGERNPCRAKGRFLFLPPHRLSAPLRGTWTFFRLHFFVNVFSE